METLQDLHSWVRWLVLAVVAGAVVVGVLRHAGATSVGRSLPRLAVMVIDLQVLLGMALWVFDEGWNRTMYFKVIHPVFMLMAAAVAHAGVVVARKRPARAELVTVAGLTAALVLMVAAIPWDRL